MKKRTHKQIVINLLSDLADSNLIWTCAILIIVVTICNSGKIINFLFGE